MRITPGIDLGERPRAGVRDPNTVRSWKIENGQIRVLMAHCRAQRELYINRNRCCNRRRSD
jgi:hypothetical protein